MELPSVNCSTHWSVFMQFIENLRLAYMKTAITIWFLTRKTHLLPKLKQYVNLHNLRYLDKYLKN